jgi:hypothetical protein
MEAIVGLMMGILSTIQDIQKAMRHTASEALSAILAGMNDSDMDEHTVIGMTAMVLAYMAAIDISRKRGLAGFNANMVQVIASSGQSGHAGTLTEVLERARHGAPVKAALRDAVAESKQQMSLTLRILSDGDEDGYRDSLASAVKQFDLYDLPELAAILEALK